MANEQGSDLINVCGLWRNEGRNGEYLSGNLGGVRVFVFRNKRKETDRHPDYTLCVAPNKRREQRE
jgi:hypothetical protein